MRKKKIRLKGQGSWLKEIRGQRNMDQMAELLGISERAYRHYENEERGVSGPVKKLIEIDQCSKIGNSALGYDLAGGWQAGDIREIPGFPKDHEFWRALKLLHEIYDSTDEIYIRAIFSNLIAFNNAIRLKKEMKKNEDRILDIENIVNKMDQRSGKERRNTYKTDLDIVDNRRQEKNRRKTRKF